MGKIFNKTIPHVVLITYVIIILYPLFFIFSSSFKGNSEIMTNPWGWPENFAFDNYVKALSSSNIGHYFWNSLYIATISTLCAILLSTAIAFALMRMRFPRCTKVVFSILLLALLIPGASLLIPLYIMINDLGIYNTPLALIVPYTAFGIPITTFIIAAFLKSIPNELEEAGVMDGLSAFGLLGRVVLPLTIPTLVTVFIVNFVDNWNEYIMASLFLSNQTLRTLPVAVVSFSDKFNMNYGALTAAITISIVPVILVYALLQKHIIAGISAGGVKG